MRVVVDNEAVSIHSFVGEVLVEFSYGLDGEYICPLAFFYDFDEHGDKRDLCAVRMGVQNASWVDSDGARSEANFHPEVVGPLAAVSAVKKAFAKKLELSDLRFEKLGN